MTFEIAEHRIKRLHMRSMRRGIREMDLILSGFARAELAALAPPLLDLYEALLDENDHDIYAWINGQIPAPARFAALIGLIAAGAQGIARPGAPDVMEK